MSYRCADYNKYLAGHHYVGGSEECARFVQAVTNAPIVHDWVRGQKVLGNGASIPAGTVIATFNHSGKYPNMNHGNHAALFLSENGHTITVVDQYKGSGGVKVSHYVKQGQGDEHHMTGDPEYYYVVE